MLHSSKVSYSNAQQFGVAHGNKEAHVNTNKYLFTYWLFELVDVLTYSSFYYLYMLYGVDQNRCILVRCSYIKYVVVYNRALNLGPVLILVFPRWGVQYVKMPSCRLVGVRVEENRRRRMQTSRRRRGDNGDNNVRRIWQ